MDDFDRYLKEQMTDPDFQKEWDDGERKHQLLMMIMKAWNEKHMTQSELGKC